MTAAECKASGGIFTTGGSCLKTASSIPGVTALVMAPQAIVSDSFAVVRDKEIAAEKRSAWLPWLLAGGVGIGIFAVLRYKRIL